MGSCHGYGKVSDHLWAHFWCKRGKKGEKRQINRLPTDRPGVPWNKSNISDDSLNVSGHSRRWIKTSWFSRQESLWISQIGARPQWVWAADFNPGQSSPKPQSNSLHRLLSCWTSIFRAAASAKSRFDFSTEQNSTLDLLPLKTLVAPSSCYGYCKAGGSSICSPAGCRAAVNIIGVDINLYKPSRKV